MDIGACRCNYPQSNIGASRQFSTNVVVMLFTSRATDVLIQHVSRLEAGIHLSSEQLDISQPRIH